MEHIYNFTEEQLIQIISNALEEGYKLKLTEWMDEWEREEGCPSIEYELDKEDYAGYKEDVYSILPEETKHGCGELNIVKNNEYICFYHIEKGDEYICAEALDFLKEN